MFDTYLLPLRQAIREWLDEDIGIGDMTTMATVPKDQQSRAVIHAKAEGIVCGLHVAQEVFLQVDPTLQYQSIVQDGDRISKGSTLAYVEGSSASILMGERLALNLLQRMSGIATKTHELVQAVGSIPVRIADTRKTTPGHRMLEKYAVRVGGGANHRFGLYDAVMIKDNHIKAAGGVEEAITAARSRIPHTMKIEVEVENSTQLEQALKAQADIIMLDNMTPELMKAASARIKSHSPHIIVEASGGVTIQNIRQIAETGVDVISSGALTHSVQALDISLDLFDKKVSNT